MKRVFVLMVLASILAVAVPAPVYACEEALPPIPDWPIIGPILRWLGLAQESSEEEEPYLDPSVTEYRIESLDDISALSEDEFEVGETVRFIATEEAANRMLSEIIESYDLGGVQATVVFEPNQLRASGQADRSLLESQGLELPRWIRSATLRANTTLDVNASACMISVEIKKLTVNGLSLGIRRLVQGAVDDAISNYWPAEVCVERVVLMDGEVAVEGYRTQ